MCSTWGKWHEETIRIRQGYSTYYMRYWLRLLVVQPIILSYLLPFSMLSPGGIDHNRFMFMPHIIMIYHLMLNYQLIMLLTLDLFCEFQMLIHTTTMSDLKNALMIWDFDASTMSLKIYNSLITFFHDFESNGEIGVVQGIWKTQNLQVWLGLREARTVDIVQINVLIFFEIFFNNAHILSGQHFVGTDDDSIILYSNEISDSVWFGLLKISVDVGHVKVSKITDDFRIIFTHRDYDLLSW